MKKGLFTFLVILLSFRFGNASPNDELIKAIDERDLNKVQIAVNAGADVNYMYQGVWPVIHFMYGKVLLDCKSEEILKVNEILKYFITKKINMNAKWSNGRTILHEAVSNNCISLVSFLLAANGLDVNAKDDDGVTALALASGDGKYEIVKMLLVKGAEPNSKDNEGETAILKLMSYATTCKNVENKKIDDIAFLKTIKDFLKYKNIDLNAQDAYGNTLLHKACSYGNIEVIRLFMLNKNINVFVKNKSGNLEFDGSSDLNIENLFKTHPRRFVDNGNGTITDSMKNISWEKSPKVIKFDFENAYSYIKNLKLGGYSDWSGSFDSEIASLIDGITQPYQFLKNQGFNCQPGEYYSSVMQTQGGGFQIVVINIVTGKLREVSPGEFSRTKFYIWASRKNN